MPNEKWEIFVCNGSAQRDYKTDRQLVLKDWMMRLSEKKNYTHFMS